MVAAYDIQKFVLLQDPNPKIHRLVMIVYLAILSSCSYNGWSMEIMGMNIF